MSCDHLTECGHEATPGQTAECIRQLEHLPVWYVAQCLRGVAHVIEQNPRISDGQLAGLWSAYNLPGVAP